MIKLYPEFEFSDSNASYNLYFDQNLRFYLQKVYSGENKPEAIAREKEIMNKKCSNNIVQITKEATDSIYIPYFPMGTLSTFLDTLNQNNTPRIDISDVDKVVILYQIATALKDLHSIGEYHGFLSTKVIYISAKKDAYLGSIIFDKDKESQLTKPSAGFYTQTPKSAENIKNSKTEFNNCKNDQNEFNPTDEDKIQTDIYSFGVLMYSVFTSKSPDIRMDKLTRAERLNILSGDYCGFLFQENKEIFQDDKMDFVWKILKTSLIVDVEITKLTLTTSPPKSDAVDQFFQH